MSTVPVRWRRRQSLTLVLVLLFTLLLPAAATLAADDFLFTKHSIDVGLDSPVYMALADMDGDGDLDVIAAANVADQIVWWENSAGDGTVWLEHVVATGIDGARAAHPADIDGDGDLDVIGAAADADDVIWWENEDGVGTSWTPRTIDPNFDGAYSVYGADVDGDGDLDVLAVASVADDVVWYDNTAGNGSGWIKRTIDDFYDGAYYVTDADMDDDGDTDVLAVANTADDVTWWENANGIGTVWTEHTIDSFLDGAIQVEPADVDGDGDLDVLAVGNVADDVVWYENTDGSGLTWTKQTVDPAFDGVVSLAPADVDDDGDLDVLAVSDTLDNISWWENLLGDGSDWVRRPFSDVYDGARWVAAGDMDADGDTDVAAVARDADEVAWWEKTTAWTGRTVTNTFNGAWGTTARDVDGDGDLDIVGAAFDDDAVTWWRNDAGDGTVWTEYPIAGDFDGAAAVWAADLDGDGDTDVAAAALNDDLVGWWENADGLGLRWEEHLVASDYDGATAVQAADLDGDGDLDLLGAARNAHDVTFWRNLNGDGSAWETITIAGDFDGAQAVATGDVDGDGDLDVLGAAYKDNNVSWWENLDGSGSAWTSHLIVGSLSGAASVAAADLDRDGDLDVVAAGEKVDAVAWWENENGFGTDWQFHLISSTMDGAASVTIADVDGDGDPDILAAARVANTVQWWENTFSDGTFWFPESVATAFDGAKWVEAADIDGDDDLDILGAAYRGDSIIWWEQERAPWRGRLIQAGFAGASDVDAGDIDGDGDLDVAGAAHEMGTVAWWQNVTGTGALWQSTPITGTFEGARAVVLADMDGDRDLDVVGAADQNDTVAWFENKNSDGLEWIDHTVSDALDGASDVDTADFDGDGYQDIVAAARWADTITVYGNADGLGTTWTTTVVTAAFDGAISVQAADLNNDGFPDIVAAANGADRIAAWLNNGDGTAWTGVVIANGFDGAQGITAADIDGDGDVDVAGAARWDGEVRWWENLGGGAWTAHLVAEDLDGAYGLAAALVDNDGDTDILSAADEGNAINWLDNANGDGTLWTVRPVANRVSGARAVLSGDLDGDSDTDILGAAFDGGLIAWWENTAPLPPNFTLEVTPEVVDICAPAEADYDVDVGQITGFSDPVTLDAAGFPSAATATFSRNPVTPPGTSILTIGDTAGAEDGAYEIIVTGTATIDEGRGPRSAGVSGTIVHTDTVTLNLYDAAPGAPTLLEPPDNALNQPVRPTFVWSAAVQGATYDLEVATDNSFNDLVYEAKGLSETSHTITIDLAIDTVYYWRVRASNSCGTGVYSEVFNFTTEPPPGICPAGTVPQTLYTEDFEAGAFGWTHSGVGDTWELSSERPYTGSFAYHAEDVETVSDQLLFSPAVALPTGEGPVTLKYWNWQAIEHREAGGCWDGAILEISTDEGQTWTQLEDELLTDPYDGEITGTSGNPLGGLNGWCGDIQPYRESVVDLDAYAGQDVSFRYRLGTDDNTGREGWYIDDVTVQSCQATGFSLAAEPTTAAICTADDASYDISVDPIGNFTAPVTLSADGHPAGTTATFTPNPVTPPGSSDLTIGNTAGAAFGSYIIDVMGETLTSTQAITVGLDVYSAVPDQPTLLTPADGATGERLQPTFTWSAPAQGQTYDIQIARDAAFTDIVVAAPGLTETLYIPDVTLDPETTFYWRVQPRNACGKGTLSAVSSFVTGPPPGLCPTGTTPDELYYDGFETGAPGWTLAGFGGNWTLTTTRPYIGSYSWWVEGVDSVSDQLLMSPDVILPAGQEPLTLQFWNWQEIEHRLSGGCWDGGILEITNDGGFTWQQLEAELVTDPYDGVVRPGGPNPLQGLNAWCGDPQDWLLSIVELDAFAGEAVNFRFRLGTDASIAREGWYVDEVVVQACVP